jgi:hypothetical protein
MTTGSRQVGALLVFLTLVGADSTHAQLRSLAALKYLALESGAEAEQQTEALRTHDSLKNHQGLLVPTLDSVPAEGHPYFARCVVRGNLPEPLTVGLECYDAAGAYVETKRAVNVDQLAFEVWSAITNRNPLPRPLHTYRYIYVQPVYGEYQAVDFLVSLLRKSPFTVIQNHEALAMPAPERDLILRCRIGDTTIHTNQWFHSWGSSQLSVFNMDNYEVRDFRSEARWFVFSASEAQMQRKMMESAVQKLIRARQEDEVTYGRPEKR